MRFLAPNSKSDTVITESILIRISLILIAIAFMTLLLVVPLIAVFSYAFSRGWEVYLASLVDRDTLAAAKLTLLTTAVSLLVNLAFGLCSAWCLSKFRFRGRRFLLALIELPLTVSPVIAGLALVLLFGSGGIFASWLDNLGCQIIFAVPGVIIATTFITLPFIVRELMPLMESQGTAEEEAALVFGASGTQVYRWVTLPNIKWALLYAVIICSARAMGEFGAVSVVSGHIRGQTNTLPLQVEILYNEYNFASAFAVASLLTLVAMLTIVIRRFLERQKL